MGTINVAMIPIGRQKVELVAIGNRPTNTNRTKHLAQDDCGRSEMAKQSFSPVRVDLEKAVADARRTRAGFSKAWGTLEEEYTALHALLNARKRAGPTQQDLAERMGTTKSAISRLENSLRDGKHSPSFATLKKYARACGRKLVVDFV
jgi:DNA-binding XRE family transcriptional regulator